jgi:hypothetical protein
MCPVVGELFRAGEQARQTWRGQWSLFVLFAELKRVKRGDVTIWKMNIGGTADKQGGDTNRQQEEI